MEDQANGGSFLVGGVDRNGIDGCWLVELLDKEFDGSEPGQGNGVSLETTEALARTRKQVQLLDDLYKNAVVSITSRYVKEQDTQPAALVAKDVFGAMQKKGYHQARLVDASGNPQNADNKASSAFEKKAVEAIRSGKPYFDQVIEKDGKSILQAATIVPAVMPQCANCHGVKEGELLGAIVYELPIE